MIVAGYEAMLAELRAQRNFAQDELAKAIGIIAEANLRIAELEKQLQGTAKASTELGH